MDTNTTKSVWDEYSKRLKIFISTKIDKEEVEDILQDIFLKIHKGLPDLKESEKIESWIYQITRNRIIDHYKSEKFHSVLPEDFHEEKEYDNLSVRKELANCIIPLISLLPENYKSPLILFEFESKTIKEISQELDLSIPGVKSRLQRGREQFKKILMDCCKFEINRNKEVVDFEPKDKNCKVC